MTHRHKRVAAVTSITEGSTTSGDLLTGVTVIPVGNSDDFHEGNHVLIDGEVYTYDHELVDDGEESGQPSITLDTGLVADVADDTAVDLWNASDGTTVIEWQATVTDDIDGSAGTATLLQTLIPFLPAGMPLAEGDSVAVMVDAEGDWWIVDVPGKKAAFDPQHIATGSLSAETTITAGDPDGKRVAMNGTEGAFEAFDSTNDQTVKVDGAANYMEGTFATAKPGEPRVAMGPGLLGGDPTNEVRLDSENPNETAPAVLSAFAVGPISVLALTAATVTGPGTTSLQITGGDSVGIAGDVVSVSGPVTFADPVDATMGDGSVGTGTYRDSVDARVAAVLAGYGHVERSADGTQNIAHNTTTAVLWQNNPVAARGGITYNTGTGAFDIGEAGTYLICAFVGIAANAAGRRLASIRKNGTGVATVNVDASSAGQWSETITQCLDLAAGDDIDVVAFHNAGAGVNLALATGSYITIHRVA